MFSDWGDKSRQEPSALYSSGMNEVNGNDQYVRVRYTKILKLLCGVPTTSTCRSMEMSVYVLCARVGTNIWTVTLRLALQYLVPKNYLRNHQYPIPALHVFINHTYTFPSALLFA